MLVLSRKKLEVVHIGNDIEIVVVEVQGDRVRLGFKAPDDVKIHRHEVWISIQEQNQQPIHKAA
jgi:carbon storage regulator